MNLLARTKLTSDQLPAHTAPSPPPRIRVSAKIPRPFWEAAMRLKLRPSCSIEIQIPDFKVGVEVWRIIMEERPEHLNHNVGTMLNLFKIVQSQDHDAGVASCA